MCFPLASMLLIFSGRIDYRLVSLTQSYWHFIIDCCHHYVICNMQLCLVVENTEENIISSNILPRCCSFVSCLHAFTSGEKFLHELEFSFISAPALFFIILALCKHILWPFFFFSSIPLKSTIWVWMNLAKPYLAFELNWHFPIAKILHCQFLVIFTN